MVDSTVCVNIEKMGGLGWTCTVYRMCELGRRKVQAQEGRALWRTQTKMSVIMIESPYSGDSDRNIRYLVLCGFDDAILHDECGYASHGWMTQHPRAKPLK